MNRRGFLKGLLGSAAALAVVPMLPFRADAEAAPLLRWDNPSTLTVASNWDGLYIYDVYGTGQKFPDLRAAVEHAKRRSLTEVRLTPGTYVLSEPLEASNIRISGQYSPLTGTLPVGLHSFA